MSQPDNSKLATASSPIRMRVQGMDCAKDAAEIERAAAAGVSTLVVTGSSAEIESNETVLREYLSV